MTVSLCECCPVVRLRLLWQGSTRPVCTVRRTVELPWMKLPVRRAPVSVALSGCLMTQILAISGQSLLCTAVSDGVMLLTVSGWMCVPLSMPDSSAILTLPGLRVTVLLSRRAPRH